MSASAFGPAVDRSRANQESADARLQRIREHSGRLSAPRSVPAVREPSEAGTPWPRLSYQTRNARLREFALWIGMSSQQVDVMEHIINGGTVSLPFSRKR